MTNSEFRTALQKFEAAEITRAQLARVAGCSYTTVHRFLNKDLELTNERRRSMIEKIREWQKQVRAVCFTLPTAR
jgi:AraC-like DNA-binding protein